MGREVKDLLTLLGVVLFIVVLFSFPVAEEKPEILHGHSFLIERNGEYLGYIPRKADGVTYYRTGWGPKSQARSYGEWIRAYEDVREWGGQIVIQRYEPVSRDE